MLRPLHGIVVFEKVSASAPLHVRLAVALAGKIARESGADVHVVTTEGCDTLGHLPPFSDGGSALAQFLNGGKTFGQSAAMPDVVLADAATELLRAGRSVVVSTFGRGQPDGPASELTLLAMSGMLHVLGEQVGQPLRLPGHQPAYAAGLAAYLALTAALLGDESLIADVSVLDAMLWVNWKLPAVTLMKQDPSAATPGEWQALDVADGHVALVYQDRDWPALVEMTDLAELRQPRFSSRGNRLANHDALLALLRPWFAARTKVDIYAEAKRCDVPLGPVWCPTDLLNDAQYLERDFLALLPNGGFFPKLPVMWDGHRLPLPANV